MESKFKSIFLSSVLFAVVFSGHGFSSLGMDIVKDCDLPGDNIGSSKLNTPEACKDKCLADKKCQGFVFISGWNRCFIKQKYLRLVKLKMSSGQIIENQQDAADAHNSKGMRKVKLFGDRVDHSSKDLKRVSNIENLDKCGQRCLQEERCYAFTYLDGYRDCWLKGKGGSPRDKIFYCGIKTSK
ncbi:MAG: PAN domain-containing protein [Bdellovibrionota bacterium]